MPSRRLADAVRGRAAALRADLADTPRVQVSRLRGLVLDNLDTEFGRAHDFSSMAGLAERSRSGRETDAARLIAEWQRCVPVAAPEAFAPGIARAAAGVPDVLFRGRAIALEATGGSTSGARHVAYHGQSLIEFQQAALPWLDDLFTTEPSLVKCPAYWAISPIGRRAAQRNDARHAVSIGMDDAAYLGDEAGAGLLASLAVPPAVGAIDASEPGDAGARCGGMHDWQRVTLAHLLACRPLGLISVWSPSFLSVLLQILDDEGEQLIEAIRSGPCALAIDHARIPLAALQWPTSQRRADELAACRIEGGATGPTVDPSARFDLSRVWPQLRLISCWADAGSGVAAAALAQRLPHARMQAKGLLATEGAITLPLSPWPDPVLAIRSGFYEFLDTGDVARTAGELRVGDRYRVVLSNASGLYRYRLGDVVECTGMAGRAPMLRFIGRGDRIVDLVGEKLDDAFVATCLDSLPAEAWPSGRRPIAAMLAAVDQPGQASYRLLIDQPPMHDARTAATLADALDAALSRNPQYAYARRLGQLGAPQVRAVADLTRRWVGHRLTDGQSIGDVKLPALLAATDGDRLVLPDVERLPAASDASELAPGSATPAADGIR